MISCPRVAKYNSLWNSDQFRLQSPTLAGSTEEIDKRYTEPVAYDLYSFSLQKPRIHTELTAVSWFKKAVIITI